MTLSPGHIALLTISIIAIALLTTVLTLYFTTGKNNAKCTRRSTFCASRPPTCDFSEFQKDAKLPSPVVTQSTGYDWVAANYALNLFVAGANAYTANKTPQAFPHTKTLGVLSGIDVPDPATVSKRRLHNIVWIVKVDGGKSRPDQIYIIWRGTQTNPEWIIDADMLLVPWLPETPNVLVHRGYDNAIKEVREELYALLKKHITRPDNTVVYVSGLSLGGGLTTVATADLLTRSNLGLKDVRMYAFSAPRVGNKAFVDMMKGLNKAGGSLVDMYTIINAYDAIPKLPPNTLGYESMPALTFAANWGDPGNNHLMAVQFAHLDRVYQKCPMPAPLPDLPV